MFADIFNRPIRGLVAELLAPPPGLEFDFSRPEGEAALVAPDSVSWRVFKNPVSLFVGGVAAVILELAEPSVRAGIWDHSTFKRDAVSRLRRTGAAAMMTVYGPRSAAERMIARVVRMHEHVSGTTSKGVTYHANDPRLLDWVQATASFGFIEAYSRYVSTLSADERSRAYGEGAEAAMLYGATGAPRSVSSWEGMLQAVEPSLERSEIVLEFLEIMNSAEILPLPLRPAQRMLVRAAIDLVPDCIATKLGFEGMTLPATWRFAVVAMAKAVNIPIAGSPPTEACKRMGLAANYLYR